jgi:hypothetical protein
MVMDPNSSEERKRPTLVEVQKGASALRFQGVIESGLSQAARRIVPRQGAT